MTSENIETILKENKNLKSQLIETNIVKKCRRKSIGIVKNNTYFELLNLKAARGVFKSAMDLIKDIGKCIKEEKILLAGTKRDEAAKKCIEFQNKYVVQHQNECLDANIMFLALITNLKEAISLFPEPENN